MREFERLYPDPRFQDLLRRMKLPPVTPNQTPRPEGWMS
jgi:hypothetical protein